MMDKQDENPNVGIPRWLIYGFAMKLALVVAITVGVVWYVSR